MHGHPGDPSTCSRHQKHSTVFLSARSPPALSGAAPWSATQVALSGCRGIQLDVRKYTTTWSPLTESNRRPSAYHPGFSRFTAQHRARRASSHRRPARIGTCGRPGKHAGCERRPVSPGPANGGIMGIRHAIQAQSVRLSPARPRPGRRSDDGQTILLPVWQDQKCLAEQALPLPLRSLTIHPHPTLSETIAMAAEAFEGTITDLYLPKRREPPVWRRASQPGTGLPASSDRIQMMKSAIAANWHVAAAQTYAWKISW